MKFLFNKTRHTALFWRPVLVCAVGPMKTENIS